MKHLLCLGLLATMPALGACTDDEPPVTSSSNSDPGSSTDDTLASDVTNIESSGGSESSTVSAGSESSDGSSGESGTGSGSSSGESSDTAPPESSSSDGETAACEVITEDVSAIGTICDSAADCPEDYGCFSQGGFNPQPFCNIPCTMDCECPTGHVCTDPVDQGEGLMPACLPG